jgi:hypothetical protein
MAERPMALSFVQSITLSPSLLQRMASNNNGKCKLEDEAESPTARKRLRPSDDDGGDDDSSNSPEEETEEPKEEVEETSMNQLDTSEEKLFARRARGWAAGSDLDCCPFFNKTFMYGVQLRVTKTQNFQPTVSW